ncbi:polymorphic toxin-type HINT domain-containing protein [Novipirellula sp. SH528]|uniref:polymorphic toxin-type HINT domain-containing protein n=1 Tax=Novipirellula sp. SH528 TaxID=3454466 RepID=UPI003FA14BBB
MVTVTMRYASVKQFALRFGLLVCGVFLISPARAAELESSSDPVKAALEAEARGELTDRTTLVESSNKPDLARWHAGQVFVDGQWVGLDQLSAERLTPRLKQYVDERGEGELDIEAHRRLARWAEANQLDPQARAHWQGVIALNPDDRVARVKLGQELVNGQWLSKDEIRDAKQQSKELAKQAKVWLPKMKKWAASISGSDTKDKLKTLEALRQLEDPSAVYALKLAAFQLPDDLAFPFVEAIRNVRSREACNALTEIAVKDPASKSGQAAVAGLKEYRMAFYVPRLLESLSGDVLLRHQVFTRPNGDEVLRIVKSRELQDVEQVSIVDNVVQANKRVVITDPRSQANALRTNARISIVDLNIGKNAVASRALRRDIERQSEQMRSETDEENRARVRGETRIYDVLQSVSGEEVERNAVAWWDWWDRYNEAMDYGAENKRYDVSYDQDRRNTIYAVQFSRMVALRTCECLIAGTQVQTECGPKPVESIRTGDLVLSQDVETGELSLKPVLQATQRPPAKTLRFSTAGGEIQATLGHYWWVAGEGWLRTKELEVGMMLHHATGASRIQSIEQVAEPVKTFNLIVADNHTYFVGPERLLSNDATELSPTLKVVPGLPVASLASNKRK